MRLSTSSLSVSSSTPTCGGLNANSRIDTTIILDEHIYLFEFKIDKTAQDAMDQIHKQKYYEKYLLENKPITLVGANFSSEKKMVEKWLVESIELIAEIS